MNLPHFLVIGAMKAGTTSFCKDLESHPQIYFPVVKEPHTLLFNKVITSIGKKKYAAIFKHAKSNQLIGDGSTGYSKFPQFKDVAERARKVLGNDLKIIYIIRDPVARSISHHYHDFRAGDAPLSFEDALLNDPMILNCSLYGLQIEQWLRFFPIENFHIIKFEEYISCQEKVVKKAVEFLGCDSKKLILRENEKHNVGKEEVLPPKILRNLKNKIARSQWFKRNIQTIIPTQFKQAIKKKFYKKIDGLPTLPSNDSIQFIITSFKKDFPRAQVFMQNLGIDYYQAEDLDEKYLESQ